MTERLHAYCITRDEAFGRAVTTYAEPYASVQLLRPDEGMDRVLPPSTACMFFIDLRSPKSLDWIERIKQLSSQHVIMVFGLERSDPMREAIHLGVYATEPLELDRLRFQTLVAHAADRLGLCREIDILSADRRHAVPVETPRPGPSPMPLQHFARAMHRFSDPSALLDSLVEGLAGTARVSRAGLFTQVRDDAPFQLQAGLRCLEVTQSLAYAPSHPLVNWLAVNAHMVARSTLAHIGDAASRLLLTQTLDQLGAELIAPIFARGRLAGWLFIGQRATGVPFTYDELENISVVSEHIATTLENAKLYEEVTLQKTLAETLFQSIPIGIVAVGEDGYIRWFNDAAGTMLAIPSAEAIGQPVALVGSRLADHLHRTYQGEMVDRIVEWEHPHSHRHLTIDSHRLVDKDERALGAVMLIHDQTATIKLREKQEQLSRAVFWTELAASMSHEIRNPLVAIKTFAQLLPGRFDDPDFRAEFSEMVTREVGRLDGIIEQINVFANPPPLEFKAIDVARTIDEAVKEATSIRPGSSARIEAIVDPSLPKLVADEPSIRSSLTHLVVNALEALPRKEDGRIEVRAESYRPSAGGVNGSTPPGVMFTVQDNGHGIPREIHSKVYSPFCTTKARGMGLGLPISKRTAVDHNGEIDIESGRDGTRVTLRLPSAGGLTDEQESGTITTPWR